MSKLQKVSVRMIAPTLPDNISTLQNASLELKTNIENRVVDIHRSLEAVGDVGEIVFPVDSLRSQPGSGTKALTISDVQLKKFFAEIENIVLGMEEYEWKGVTRPKIAADLTALTVTSDEIITIYDIAFSTNFNFTKFASPPVFSVYGKNIRFCIKEHCDFGELRIEIKNNSSMTLQAECEIISSPLRIYSNIPRHGELPMLNVDAQNVKFKSKVALEEGLSIANLQFSGASFDRELRISAYAITKPSDFSNCEFKKNVVFRRVAFSHAPNFQNCVHKKNLIFDTCKFFAANKIFGSTCSFDDIEAYRTLRLHFGKIRNARMEGIFYSLELRGERILSHTDAVDKALSWCFDILSNYGQSTTRIVISFFMWNAFFILLYSTIFKNSFVAKIEPFAAYPSLSFALQNAFNPLALFSEKNIVSATSIASFVSALAQSLGSLAIITIFLLTVRTRFRRGGGSPEG